jgi:hypothetical protein
VVKAAKPARSQNPFFHPVCRCFVPVFHLIKCPVLRNALALLVVPCLASLACGQQPVQPRVKVNVLNVCSPSPEEQKEIASALARVPKEPLFGIDFEVDRGRSVLEEPPGFLQGSAQTKSSSGSATADWVRIRREFAVQALFASVQYSFSRDAEMMNEVLVFRVREPKDLMELSIEDNASAVTTPAAMLAVDTPATHIKLERFGKPSVVLARCSASQQGPPPDQSVYEPLFRSATSVIARYRSLLGAPEIVPDELDRVRGVAVHKERPASKLRKPVHAQR